MNAITLLAFPLRNAEIWIEEKNCCEVFWGGEAPDFVNGTVLEDIPRTLQSSTLTSTQCFTLVFDVPNEREEMA